MFHLIAVLCMMSYEGEVCKTYVYATPFETKAACMAQAKAAEEKFAASGDVFIRIKELRCNKPVAKEVI